MMRHATVIHALAAGALLVLGLVSASEAGSAKLPPEEAAKHVGETASVEGVVVNVGHGKTGTVYLNFGAAFPNQVFSAVIKAESKAVFPEADGLEGKTVTVTGVITLYKDKPEIVLEKREQLQP
jgi:DNA/RNA endonuclease YhcR with UshA esterase domain